jgi:hypothetical protein
MFAFGLIGWFVWGPSLIWQTGIGGWTGCLFPPVGFAVGASVGYCAGFIFAPAKRPGEEPDEVIDDGSE